MNASEIAQKARQLQDDFKSKGKDITISEAVARVTGKFTQSFESNLVDMATEVVCYAEQEGRNLEFSEALNLVYAENPGINAVVKAEDIKTLEKLKIVANSLKVFKDKAFDLQHQEILKAFERFKKRDEKEDIAQGLINDVDKIISGYDELVKTRKELGLPPPEIKDPRTVTFSEK